MGGGGGKDSARLLHTINSLLPNRTRGCELPSAPRILCSPPSGGSLGFWGDCFTCLSFCRPLSGLKVPRLVK
ncbi:hypothetical protein FKM82_021668 [Ascaphus truei]